MSLKLSSTPLALSKNQTSLPHRPFPLSIRKSHLQPSNLPLSSEGETSGNEWVGGSKKSSSYVIHPELLAQHKSLTAKVQDFQEGVRTLIKQKYAQNHKVITFEPYDIVTLCIPKKDRAATDNYRVVVLIKGIPHEGRHQIKTKFAILDRLYPTGELNVIPSVDQDVYRKDFLEAPTKFITLDASAARLSPSNKVAVSCYCKKLLLLSQGVNVGRTRLNVCSTSTISIVIVEMPDLLKQAWILRLF